MEDETTTTSSDVSGDTQVIQGVQVDGQGQAVSVPENADTEAAASATETQTSEGTPETETGEQDSSVPDTDKDAQLQKFAKSHGLELDSPSAVKAAKMAMDNQAEFQRNRQRASELEKATHIADEQVPPDATPETRDNVRIRNLELKDSIREWKYQNQEKLAYEADMVQVLSDPKKRLLVQEGYLTLDDVYSIARGSKTDDTAIKSKTERETLERLAQKQQAQSPKGNATNASQLTSETITPKNVDSMVASHDTVWFRQHLDEINKAMAG